MSNIEIKKVMGFAINITTPKKTKHQDVMFKVVGTPLVKTVTVPEEEIRREIEGGVFNLLTSKGVDSFTDDDTQGVSDMIGEIIGGLFDRAV